MKNHLRNHYRITINNFEFLLRPDFEALHEFESNFASIAQISVDMTKKKFPGVAMTAALIFLCQKQEPRLTRDEVFDMVMTEGGSVVTRMLSFYAQLMSGFKGEQPKDEAAPAAEEALSKVEAPDMGNDRPSLPKKPRP